MKRVRCPKCDNYIIFDETKYADGQSLVFQCPECGKEFGIRMGVSKLRERRKTRIQTRMRMRMDVVQSSSLKMSSIINKSCH